MLVTVADLGKFENAGTTRLTNHLNNYNNKG